MVRTVRKIVHIDEALCDGCGDCLPSCAEGAIALVGGKARMRADALCDGLGACLGACPKGAITVVEREAEPFDEAQVKALHAAAAAPRPRPRLSVVHDPAPAPAAHPATPRAPGDSRLGHWPVQLRLVNPQAPWLKGADVLVAADCVPFAYARFHERFLDGRVVLVACPKLDDAAQALAKLEGVFCAAAPQSVTVVRMEVPCCGGISMATRRALAAAGSAVAVSDVVVGVDGKVRGD